MKKLLYIFGITVLLLSCNSENIYQVAGRLSNLENTTLYIVYGSSDGNSIDTVLCNEQGDFSITRQKDDSIREITVYYNNRTQWFLIYPEAGKPVQVKGDAGYPLLLQIKGGRTNNKISEFKKKVSPLLKELTDISLNAENKYPQSSDNIRHIANINSELRIKIEEYVNKNPNEEASAVLISEYFSDPDEIYQAEEFLNLLTPKLNDYYIVKNLKSQISKAKLTMVGAKAPAFKVTDIYGRTYTDYSFSNKDYILAFTALWCDMCNAEIIKLSEIATKYPRDTLDILLISLDDDFNEIRNRISKDSIKWNLVTDSAGQSIKLFESYNIHALPNNILIDRNGIIKLKTANGMELQQAVDEIFK